MLQGAGLKVTAAASSVEESDAARAFGNGAAPSPASAPPKAAEPAEPAEARSAPHAGGGAQRPRRRGSLPTATATRAEASRTRNRSAPRYRGRRTPRARCAVRAPPGAGHGSFRTRRPPASVSPRAGRARQSEVVDAVPVARADRANRAAEVALRLPVAAAGAVALVPRAAAAPERAAAPTRAAGAGVWSSTPRLRDATVPALPSSPSRPGAAVGAGAAPSGWSPISRRRRRPSSRPRWPRTRRCPYARARRSRKWPNRCS